MLVPGTEQNLKGPRVFRFRAQLLHSTKVHAPDPTSHFEIVLRALATVRINVIEMVGHPEKTPCFCWRWHRYIIEQFSNNRQLFGNVR